MELKKEKTSQNSQKKPVKNQREERPAARNVKLISPQDGKLIAITGGIGTGKTFVLEVLNKLGFEVFNADKAIHEMMKRGGAAFDKVASLFPKSVTEEGIDRKVLGEIVISDLPKLRALEEILHPLVRQAQVDFVVSVRKGSGKSMVFEIPLLFENKREKNYDLIISTIAPVNVQKKRALERPSMTEEKFDAIIKKQVSNHIRVKGSQYVIYTAKSKEDTIRQIKAIIKGNNVKRDSSRYRDNRPVRKKRGQDS